MPELVMNQADRSESPEDRLETPEPETLARLRAAQVTIAALIVHDKISAMQKVFVLLEQEVERRENKGAVAARAQALLDRAEGPTPPEPTRQVDKEPTRAPENPSSPVVLRVQKARADRRVDTTEAARMLGISPQTLQGNRYAHQHNGEKLHLPFQRDGRQIYYLMSDVIALRESPDRPKARVRKG